MKFVTKFGLIVALLITTLSSQAQSYITFHGGANLSWVSINGINDNFLPNREMKVTGFGGVGYETRVYKQLYFQTGVDFQRRGFFSDISTTIPVFDIPFEVGASAHTTMDYLSVPLFLKFLAAGEKVKFYGYIGPRLALAIDGRVRSQANFIVTLNTGTVDLDPSGNFLRQFEIGGEIGGGIQFNAPNQKDKMFVGLSYFRGFNSALEDQLIDIDIFNNGLGIQAGYKLAIGGNK